MDFHTIQRKDVVPEVISLSISILYLGRHFWVYYIYKIKVIFKRTDKKNLTIVDGEIRVLMSHSRG